MAAWVVYTRPGCSLCEEFCLELADWLGAQASAVEVVDISGNPELERRYGTRQPVLQVDGEFVCAYRLDRTRLPQQPLP